DYVQGGKWLDALRARLNKLRTDGFNAGVCPVHHVPLQRSVVYAWSHSSNCPDPRPECPDDGFFRREEKYPLRLSYSERRTHSGAFHKRKVSERFCPVC